MSDLRKLLGLGDDVKLTKGERQLADLIEQQQKMIVELKATVERLHGVERDETCYGQIIMEILDTPPHQNLNAVKRSAYEHGYKDGYNLLLSASNGIAMHNYIGFAEKEAAQRYPDKE